MRVFKKRDQWWVDFRDPDGNRRRKPVGKSKREALAALESIQASILAGTYFDDHTRVQELAAGKVTLGQLWKEYRAGRTGVSESTWKHDEVRVEKVIFLFFGKNTTLEALTPASFAKFVRWRLERGVRSHRGVTKSTVSRDLSVIRSMWKWGRQFLPGGVPPCPIPKNSDLKLPYQSPPRIDFLSREELDIVLAEAARSSPDHLLPAVALGAFAGLRRGELCNLRWADVDLESRVLRVRNYAHALEQRRTKNEEDRLVPLHPRLVEILRDLQVALLREGALPELVLPVNRKGQPIRSFQGAWSRLLKRCGLRHLPIHSLRHTCASHMVMAGVPLLSVARFLGHKSTKMTERYAHLAPEHLSSEMRRVDAWQAGGPSREVNSRMSQDDSSEETGLVN